MNGKNTHFSNRDSLKDAMKNLGLKHCDIDMKNKRAPVDNCMSVTEVIEKPMNFKKGGLTPSMPVDKMHRLKKGGCMYAEGGLVGTKSISSSKLMSKAIKKSR